MEPFPSSQMGLALVGPPLRYSQHSLLPLLNPQTWLKQTTAAALPGLIQQLFLAKASSPSASIMADVDGCKHQRSSSVSVWEESSRLGPPAVQEQAV